ncbi:MAG: lytic transglycosylase domain-containing protein, partial [Alphaproteobacteria bacterium]
SYGRITGNFSVVAALATLAYDGRRASYFRSELLNALRILQEGHISPAAMRGSWAGAMGQNQFMPSSFLRFAVDHDGDGRRDIWGTQADVFASIANYLAGSGWNQGQTWGRPVLLPAGFDAGLAGSDGRRALDRWSRLGVVQADGSPLPASDLAAEIVLPAKRLQPAFVTYDNYRVLLRWNRSNYFALAVSEIADRIAAP